MIRRRDFITLLGGASKQVRDVCSIGYEGSRFDVLTCHANRRQSRVYGQGADTNAVAVHDRVANHVKCIGPFFERVEYGRNFLRFPDFEGSDTEAQRAGRSLNLSHL